MFGYFAKPVHHQDCILFVGHKDTGHQEGDFEECPSAKPALQCAHMPRKVAPLGELRYHSCNIGKQLTY